MIILLSYSNGNGMSQLLTYLIMVGDKRIAWHGIWWNIHWQSPEFRTYSNNEQINEWRILIIIKLSNIFHYDYFLLSNEWNVARIRSEGYLSIICGIIYIYQRRMPLVPALYHCEIMFRKIIKKNKTCY